jgi:hypothetical protein
MRYVYFSALFFFKYSYPKNTSTRKNFFISHEIQEATQCDSFLLHFAFFISKRNKSMGRPKGKKTEAAQVVFDELFDEQNVIIKTKNGEEIVQERKTPTGNFACKLCDEIKLCTNKAHVQCHDSGKELCNIVISSKSNMENLTKHLDVCHPKWIDKYNDLKRKSRSSIVTYLSPEKNTTYKWLEWIVDYELPFSFCEKPNTRRFSKLPLVSAPTLKRCAMSLTLFIKEEIRKASKGAYALIFDGWSTGSKHFIGCFISYNNNEDKPARHLLAFCQLLDETR